MDYHEETWYTRWFGKRRASGNDVKIDYPPIPKACIVAAEARKSLFESQINRRTFNMSELDEVCRFMNYETVKQWYKNLESIQKIKEGF